MEKDIHMNIFQQLTNPETWSEYLEYKKEHHHLTRFEEKDLTEYITNREYLEAVRKLFDADAAADFDARTANYNENSSSYIIPEKRQIRKMQTDKKRTVYMYPREVNYVLKLMTFLLLRKYDGIFSDNLYSFRVNTGVNRAMSGILRTPGLRSMYTYKVDISNYFNSIPVDAMCDSLRSVLAGNNLETVDSEISAAEMGTRETGGTQETDPEIADLLVRLLTNDRVLDKDILVSESKGVMAGTPFAVFLANIYLMDMDAEMANVAENAIKGFAPGDAAVEGFAQTGDDVEGFGPTGAGVEGEHDIRSPHLIYARYSDDIIVITDSLQLREMAEKKIRDTLSKKGLSVNEKKEIRTAPGESWSFLGIEYHDGKIDISSASKDKIKAKIRRKARAIKRWQIRKGLDDTKAVKAFINAMNKKFFDPDSSHELTWARWYFPVINTDETLRELDKYIQQWIRYLASGHHNKKSYEFTYEDMKKLGYISLVHEWYK